VEEEVKHQINKASRVAPCLNRTIWKNKHLSVNTKSRSYNGIVRPMRTHNSNKAGENNDPKYIRNSRNEIIKESNK
jgi:hypothetical protein